MAKKQSTSSDFDVTSHVLVPTHELCTEKEKQEIFARYHAGDDDFPRILITDKGIAHLGAKEGDLIRILRKSHTAGETVFYRIVILE